VDFEILVCLHKLRPTLYCVNLYLTWWKTLGNDTPKILEEKDIILGYNLTDKKEMTINCCILTGKKMIYEQKNYKNMQPDLYIGMSLKRCQMRLP
jgi:hypothetical protein